MHGRQLSRLNLGLYKWSVMPFGLTFALTTFMWIINDIFCSRVGEFVCVLL